MLHISTTPSSSSASNPSSFAARKVAQPQPATPLSSMSPSSHLDASAVLIVPIYDDTHEGADLLMIPISDNRNSNFNKNVNNNTTANNNNKRLSSSSQAPSPQQPTSARRTETPAAPTPPPKPRLPEGCDDWDSYLSQKKSTATLPHYDNDNNNNDDDDNINNINFLPHELEPLPEHQPQQTQQTEAGPLEPPRLQSPELNFKHSFENLGWRDCLAQSTRQRAHARALRRRPSAATVIGLSTGYYPPSTSAYYQPETLMAAAASSSAVSLRSTKRLSSASTLTINTVATAPCVLGRSAKRLSAASTLTTASMGSLLSSSASTMSGGKPRSLRRINRTRHLRAYYSDGAASLRRRLSVGISSMRDIAERREPADLSGVAAAVSLLGGGRHPGQAAAAVASSGASSRSRKSTATTATRRRLSSVSTLAGEFSAPPPYPPPEKPLPSLPVLPVVEVRELQTGERARWREMLIRSFQRRSEGVGRRRAASPWRGWTPRVVEAAS